MFSSGDNTSKVVAYKEFYPFVFATDYNDLDDTAKGYEYSLTA
jgi:hypothetical protein